MIGMRSLYARLIVVSTISAHPFFTIIYFKFCLICQ